MSKVAFLGLGAMGSRMAANLLKAGHTVTVWNRSPAAAKALIASGARKASSPKEAAEGADFVFAIVRDDDASKNVWLDSTKGVLGGMRPGAVAIESSTLTPEWIRKLSEYFRAKGISLLDALTLSDGPLYRVIDTCNVGLVNQGTHVASRVGGRTHFQIEQTVSEFRAHLIRYRSLYQQTRSSHAELASEYSE